MVECFQNLFQESLVYFSQDLPYSSFLSDYIVFFFVQGLSQYYFHQRFFHYFIHRKVFSSAFEKNLLGIFPAILPTTFIGIVSRNNHLWCLTEIASRNSLRIVPENLLRTLSVIAQSIQSDIPPQFLQHFMQNLHFKFF